MPRGDVTDAEAAAAAGAANAIHAAAANSPGTGWPVTAASISGASRAYLYLRIYNGNVKAMSMSSAFVNNEKRGEGGAPLDSVTHSAC